MRTQTEAARRLRLFEIALMIGLAVFLISGARALQTGDQLADRVVRLCCGLPTYLKGEPVWS